MGQSSEDEHAEWSMLLELERYGVLVLAAAADFLQTILNKAMVASLIQTLLNSSSNPDFSVIQYVDDTILILPAIPS